MSSKCNTYLQPIQTQMKKNLTCCSLIVLFSGVFKQQHRDSIGAIQISWHEQLGVLDTWTCLMAEISEITEAFESELDDNYCKK